MGTLSGELGKFICEDIPEEKELDEAYVNLEKEMAKVARATKLNQHTLAVKIAADVLGVKKVSKIAEHIKEIEKLEGHLPAPLAEYRSYLSDGLRKYAKQELSGEALEMFKSGF